MPLAAAPAAAAPTPSTLRIARVQAWPLSFPVPPEHRVRVGVGSVLKRDAVVVKVTTEDGLVGWGESHHARAHGTIAHFVEHALAPMVQGMDAADVNGVWQRIYRSQLASHGTGAACAMAMSGLDMALWDIRAKAVGWPLYRLLGGAPRRIPAYAGGVALGWQEPASLLDEVGQHVRAGYRAAKLRLGDSVARDLARVRAVRDAYPELTLLTDANAAYTLDDARRVMPALDELEVAWLEEPFPAQDWRSYALARPFANVALAAGENHYTRFEFNRLIDERVVTILQPDVSKTGGITETMRIAAMASAHKLAIHPHSSMTGINLAATLHVLAALGDAGGYFEADVSRNNLFRDVLVPTPFAIGDDGCVGVSDAPGIGVAVDEAFLREHPAIEGPAYA